MDEGTFHCEVKYASATAYPTSTLLSSTVSALDASSSSMNRFTSWLMTRETELASAVTTALAAAVPLTEYPKACLLVQCTILQDDGSILPACILAATVALCRARVNVIDTVTACSVAVVEVPEQRDDKKKNKKEAHLSYWADPTLDESLAATAVVTVGMMNATKQVSLWEQQQGAAAAATLLSSEATNRAMDLCRDGCRTLHRFVREHLLDEFAKEQHQQ